MKNINSKISIIKECLNNAESRVDIAKADNFDHISIKKLGISENSYLGQLVGYFQRIKICDGFINILCGDGENSIIRINNIDYKIPKLFPGALIVAFDREGNIFAINGGVHPNAELGNILYMSSDSFYWEDLEIKYANFIQWATSIKTADLENAGWKSKENKRIRGNVKDFILGKGLAYGLFLKQRR